MNYIKTYHIIHVLPIIQRDELKRGKHGPQKIVEVRVPVIGVGADAKARELRWTVPCAREVTTQYWHFFNVYHPV